jgi:N-acetylmuramoyl-L-alanine amidase
MSFRIVAKKFTPDEFDAYIAGAFKPQGWVKRIVLHNTGAPSLAQRPGGILTAQHIDNLHTYYADTKKWSGGPHLFVDATGIWVFNPLDDPGVHSPSYNSSAWGVEMLGDYSRESFTTGLGGQVQANALRALAALARLQGWPDLKNQRLILHKEDPKTTHDCPGKNVDKANFVAAASMLIPKSVAPAFKLVVSGKTIDGAFVKDGAMYAPVRALGEALGAKVKFDPNSNVVTVNK